MQPIPNRPGHCLLSYLLQTDLFSWAPSLVVNYIVRAQVRSVVETIRENYAQRARSLSESAEKIVGGTSGEMRGVAVAREEEEERRRRRAQSGGSTVSLGNRADQISIESGGIPGSY